MNRIIKRTILVALAMLNVHAIADTDSGHNVYMAECAQCHGAQALGNHSMHAPRLAGQRQVYLAEQLTLFKQGKRGHATEDVAGLMMQPFAATLNPQQIAALSQYLASLNEHSKGSINKLSPLSTGHVQGRAIYESTCADCHAQDARGSRALYSPNLTILSDWYLKAQFKAYLKGWRGDATHGSTRAKGMRSIVAQIDSNEQGVLIEFLTSLSPH